MGLKGMISGAFREAFGPSVEAAVESRPVDAVSLPIGTPAYPMIDLKTGEKVYPMDADKAYFSNAFRACLLAKSRPVSALPIDVYVRDGGVRRKATDRFSRALSALLRHRWNPYLTASEGVRWAMMTKDTLGNAFIRVQYGRDGRPEALWPMSGAPDVQKGPHGPVYDYPGDTMTPAGRYLSHEVIWIKSPIIDSDGVKGVSLADLAARELGLSIDLEEFYRRLIDNGNHFPGWLETDKGLKPEDVQKLQMQLADHKGVVHAGTVRIFDNGLTYHQTPLTMADMSLVEQERWILQQTCRTLSVPPQEVFELSNATYSNIEQGALNFATKTLSYECSCLERALSDPLWAIGREDHYVQFDMNGLLRGDYKSRMEGYRTAVMAGISSPDECRAKEDEPPYEGGSYFLRPAAYILIDPETGREVETSRSSKASQPQPGSSGEGVEPTVGNPNGRPPEDVLAPVYAEMERRVRERLAEGDNEKNRAFAARVLAPYAEACAECGIEYDIDRDIERMAAQ